MGFLDRLRGGAFGELEKFLAEYEGVEAYLEPRTPTMPQSLLLVAREGEWTRAPVSDARRAASFCRKRGVPFYDARVVGYPERMKEGRGKPAPKSPSPEELEAWFSRESSEDD